MRITKDEGRRIVNAINYLMMAEQETIEDINLLSRVLHSFEWAKHEVITGEINHPADIHVNRPVQPPLPQPFMAAVCNQLPDLTDVIEEAMARR
jgi:DNA polymerase III psi subunit